MEKREKKGAKLEIIKIMYGRATVTVYIYTVTIAHHLLLPLMHILPHSHRKNQKSTTDTIKPNTPIHGHTNGDRESGSRACGKSACLDQHVWIGV